MDAVNLMISITNREELSDLITLFGRNRVSVNFVSLGHGTALINSTPKAVTYSIVTGDSWQKVRAALEREMDIDLANKGIVFTVPIASVGGMKQLRMLLGEQEFVKKEESSLKNTKYELIIAIANTGCSDQIMKAARKAGAMGGTMIHAKGTGSGGSEDFFGVTLANEKEMIYIVVRSEIKNGVMRSIMESCGLSSSAEAVVMSLPVTETAGMRFYEMKEAAEHVQNGEEFASQAEKDKT